MFFLSQHFHLLLSLNYYLRNTAAEGEREEEMQSNYGKWNEDYNATEPRAVSNPIVAFFLACERNRRRLIFLLTRKIVIFMACYMLPLCQFSSCKSLALWNRLIQHTREALRGCSNYDCYYLQLLLFALFYSTHARTIDTFQLTSY